MATFLLVDGNSLTYRAFFALPTDMATASGQVTNAVFGFTSMLVNLLRDHRPDGVAVVFDRPEPTFRHEATPTYKAHREEAPDILRQQLGLVRQVVEVLGVPALELAGYEADDLIATLATRARDRGDDVIVVTGDRDAYQLVEDPHVRVLYNRRGVSDYVLYDEAGILERTGVTPAQYVDYAALRGDPSDNLPGVPGVGEKTAAKLIGAHGGIDGIYAALDAQTPKVRAGLAEHEAQVRSNLFMMRLVRDVPLDVPLDDLHLHGVDLAEVRQLFDFLEFRSLYDRLVEALAALGHLDPGAALGAPAATLEVTVDVLDDPGAVARLLGAASTASTAPVALAGSWASVGRRSVLDGVAVLDAGTQAETGPAAVAWFPVRVLDDAAVRAAFAALVGRGGRPVVAHDAKRLLRVLLDRDVDVRTLVLDTQIAAYLLDPAEARYPIGAVVDRYAGLSLDAPAEATPQGMLDFGSAGAGDDARPAALEAAAVAALVEPLLAALDAQGLRRLHDDVEVPLVRVLARMEQLGIAVDRDALLRLGKELAEEATDLTARIWADAGHEFNVNSTPQLRTVLYDELGLAPQKKTKTGFSTDAATLEKLVGAHPIVEHLLRYREVEKLRSTYGEGLLAEVADDGRIHATFNQTVARTGRLSSEEPNLHNIPVRSELGRRFRSAFVAAPDHLLVVADYNQIELRCIAHLAEDPGLIDAFESGRDVHTATAARVFGVAEGDVNADQRSRAKMVSYGLAYGMEAYGLAQRLNIPTSEAAAILDAYFGAFPSVHAYMERTVEEARRRGYTETLFGRRRQIPELASSNFRIRQAGERQAMNAGIQGLAADIFKVALVRLDAALEDRAMTGRIVLQVHDEIIVEVPPAELDATMSLVADTMAGAFALRVPLAVNLSSGRTWADAK